MKATRVTSLQECLLPTPCGGRWVNTTVEINTYLMMMVMMMRDQRTAVVFIGAAHLCVNNLGCMCYFLFTVGKLIFILEILQDSVFSF